MWHAFKLYQKKSKKVSKNRPAVTKGILLRRLNVEIVFTFHLVRNSCLQTDSFGVFWRVRGHLFICFYFGLSIFLIGKIMIWYSSHSNEQRSKLLHFLFQFYLIELSATGTGGTRDRRRIRKDLIKNHQMTGLASCWNSVQRVSEGGEQNLALGP